MKGLVVEFLPYILVFYFLIRFMKEPIYLLGIPFVIFLRQSVFVDKALIFSQPGSYTNDMRFIGWLFIVWLSIYLKSIFKFESNEQIKFNNRYTNYQDYIIIALVFITLVGLVLTLNDYYVINDVYTEFFTLLSLFFGYFLIKGIVRFSKLEVLSEFLYNIIIINSLASILFILHQGLHLTIYTVSKEYQSFDFQGVLITRTFWFMPVLWFFSISYLLVFKRSKSIINIILISINILGIFISYTRSYLIIATIMFILYFLLTGYKSRRLMNSVKSILLIGLAGIAFFMVVSKILPASTDYFVSRFQELDKKKADTEPNNLVFRFKRTGQVLDKINPEKALFGFGSVTEKQVPFVKVLDQITSDMAWAGVVFRWGYFGLALFILLFFSSIIKAFFLFYRTEGIISQLSLLFLLIIVSQLVESFVSFAFMSPNRFAMGLWYFGMFSAVLISTKNQVRPHSIDQLID